MIYFPISNTYRMDEDDDLNTIKLIYIFTFYFEIDFCTSDEPFFEILVVWYHIVVSGSQKKKTFSVVVL